MNEDGGCAATTPTLSTLLLLLRTGEVGGMDEVAAIASGQGGRARERER